MSEALEQAEALLKSGQPAQALASLTTAVKARPADPRLRIFLAQLLCVVGAWERAHTQLNVVADMDALAIPMREMVGHALRCEILRAAVFAGRKPPMVFGAPEPWLAHLIESLLQSAQGPSALADSLAKAAFDEAPAVSGLIDGQRFEWIADADSRLGPVLEAMVNGRYYWVPFQNLAGISLEAPTDLRDRVWQAAQLRFANGGETIAMLPVRYPGSERDADGMIQLGRATRWEAIGQERWAGLGQRVLVTDLGEHDFMSVRRIDIDPRADAPEAG